MINNIIISSSSNNDVHSTNNDIHNNIHNNYIMFAQSSTDKYCGSGSKRLKGEWWQRKAHP